METHQLLRHHGTHHFRGWLEQRLEGISRKEVAELLDQISELRDQLNARDRRHLQDTVLRSAPVLPEKQKLEQLLASTPELASALSRNPYQDQARQRELFDLLLDRLTGDKEPQGRESNRRARTAGERKIYLFGNTLHNLIERGVRPTTDQLDRLQDFVRSEQPDLLYLLAALPHLPSSRLLDLLDIWARYPDQHKEGPHIGRSLLIHPNAGPQVWRKGVRVFRQLHAPFSRPAHELAQIFLEDIPESLELPEVQALFREVCNYSQGLTFVQRRGLDAPELWAQLARRWPQLLASDLTTGHPVTFEKLSEDSRSAILAALPSSQTRQQLIRASRSTLSDPSSSSRSH